MSLSIDYCSILFSYSIVTAGTMMLNAIINTNKMSMMMKLMLQNLPLVNVMKWAISGAVFTMRMPPNSKSC